MISVEHLTKYYGDFLAVDDISFEITEGHVYGFLGPNGAGKSTTMNIITGCLSATEGHVLIDGHDIFEEPNEAKRLIGYLPEHPPLYVNESPYDYLRFVGQAKGLKGAALTYQVKDVIRKTGLDRVQHRRISQLSKGYKQRVGIAQALLGDPKVIILDEPTVGLDPIQIIEIRDLIAELGQTHTVIFSSHILSEVQAICDQILMIAKGKLVAYGDPETLQQQLQASGEILLITGATTTEVSDLLTGMADVRDFTADAADSAYTTVRIRSDCENLYDLSAAISKVFANKGYVIYEMSLKKGTLEDIFVELSEGNALPANETPAERKVDKE